MNKEEIEKITGEFQSLVDIKASLEKEKEELDKIVSENLKICPLCGRS